MIKKTKNKYNHYTEDFRREVVRRANEPGACAADIARELGLHPNQIYNWRQQYKHLSDPQFHNKNDYFKDESDELRALKRKVAELEEENDFLKKATAYFSKQHL